MAKLTTQELATYVARAAELLVTLRELNTTQTYKQFAEHIRLIPCGIEWNRHFRTTMPKVSLILNAIAALENQLGGNAGELTKWIVEGSTGKPGPGYHNRVDLVITRNGEPKPT